MTLNNPYTVNGIWRHRYETDSFPARTVCGLIVGLKLDFPGYEPAPCRNCYPEAYV